MHRTIRRAAVWVVIVLVAQDHAAAPRPMVVPRPTRIGAMAGEIEDGGCVAFSPDGRTLVARNGADHQMVIWEVASLSRRLALTHPPGSETP